MDLVEGTQIDICPYGNKSRPVTLKGTRVKFILPIPEQEEESEKDSVEERIQQSEGLAIEAHSQVEAHSHYHIMALSALTDMIKTVQVQLRGIDTQLEQIEKIM